MPHYRIKPHGSSAEGWGFLRYGVSPFADDPQSPHLQPLGFFPRGFAGWTGLEQELGQNQNPSRDADLGNFSKSGGGRDLHCAWSPR
jgi:hypothetical protein